MKVAIIGSRNRKVSFEQINEVLPEETTMIISGGAMGIDRCAENFAKVSGIEFKEFLPDYQKYPAKLGKNSAAPHIRNDLIIAECDYLIAFWNGEIKSGTYSVIKKCEKLGKNHKVVRI